MNKWEDVIRIVEEKLAEGYGPAHGNNESFKVIPGIRNDCGYYAIIVDSNGKPVDWYLHSESPNAASGFGGWYRQNYDKFIECRPWVAEYNA